MNGKAALLLDAEHWQKVKLKMWQRGSKALLGNCDYVMIEFERRSK